jgi:hypothetical protein
VVVVAGSGFGEERGNGGKLIDVEAASDGGWTSRSLTRWPWKRYQAAPASELFGDCMRGGGSGLLQRSATQCGPAKRTARQRGTRWMMVRSGSSGLH